MKHFILFTLGVVLFGFICGAAAFWYIHRHDAGQAYQDGRRQGYAEGEKVHTVSTDCWDEADAELSEAGEAMKPFALLAVLLLAERGLCTKI